jgi:hypothetical protein
MHVLKDSESRLAIAISSRLAQLNGGFNLPIGAAFGFGHLGQGVHLA